MVLYTLFLLSKIFFFYSSSGLTFDGLSLENAIQRCTASEQSGKRLGVTKDDITAMDLIIRHDGREWVSKDWTKDAAFSKDPVVAEAATRLQRSTPDQLCSSPTTGIRSRPV